MKQAKSSEKMKSKEQKKAFAKAAREIFLKTKRGDLVVRNTIQKNGGSCSG